MEWSSAGWDGGEGGVLASRPKVSMAHWAPPRARVGSAACLPALAQLSCSFIHLSREGLGPLGAMKGSWWLWAPGGGCWEMRHWSGQARPCIHAGIRAHSLGSLVQANAWALSSCQNPRAIFSEHVRSAREGWSVVMSEWWLLLHPQLELFGFNLILAFAFNEQFWG